MARKVCELQRHSIRRPSELCGQIPDGGIVCAYLPERNLAIQRESFDELITGPIPSCSHDLFLKDLTLAQVRILKYTISVATRLMARRGASPTGCGRPSPRARRTESVR